MVIEVLEIDMITQEQSIEWGEKKQSYVKNTKGTKNLKRKAHKETKEEWT